MAKRAREGIFTDLIVYTSPTVTEPSTMHCVAETTERFRITVLGTGSGDQGVDGVISSDASLHGLEKDSILFLCLCVVLCVQGLPGILGSSSFFFPILLSFLSFVSSPPQPRSQSSLLNRVSLYRQANFKLVIVFSSIPKYWYCRCVPTYQGMLF